MRLRSLPNARLANWKPWFLRAINLSVAITRAAAALEQGVPEEDIRVNPMDSHGEYSRLR